MFYVLSKILGFLVTPSNFMIGLGLAGILLLPTRYTRIGRQLLVASVLLIAAIGILPLGDENGTCQSIVLASVAVAVVVSAFVLLHGMHH